MKHIYIIAGPTASGKSKLALDLAHRIGGCIVNADSMQVYRDLQILTARPTVDDMQGIEHHLYGYLGPNETSSMADWAARAADVLPQLENPIIVGGTGLYLDALINGIGVVPDIDPCIRAKVRDMDIQDVRGQVTDCSATDPQRLRRALEVQLSTGKPISYFRSQPKKKLIEANFQTFFLNPIRGLLYDNCEKRFEFMIQQGVIDEVQHLLEKGPTGGVLRAIGVAEISAFLDGRMSKQQMIESAVTATRHYAKRQITWFRWQLKDAVEIATPDVSLVV